MGTEQPGEAAGGTGEFPPELAVGREPYTETYVLRPGELLIAFRDGLDEERMGALLSGHKVVEHRLDPDSPDRLDGQSLRWVDVEAGLSPRDVARQIRLGAGSDVLLVSPVYVPTLNPVESMAAAPDLGTIIVEPPDDPGLAALFRRELTSRRLEIDPDWPEELHPLMRLHRPPETAYGDGNIIDELRALGAKEAEFDWLKIDPVEYAPQTTYWSRQWNLTAIGMPAAWDVTRGHPDVVVAVFDQAFDVGHPDLQPALRRPKSVTALFTGGAAPSSNDVQVAMKPTVAGRATTNDSQWHGTAVAGIIAARHGATSGVAGIAPDCSLMLIAVRPMTSVNVALATLWASKKGARVLNFSVSSTGPSLAIENAVRDVWATKGAVICASSGTGGPPENETARIVFPAGYREVIAVGACTSDGEPKTIATQEAWFSKYATDANHAYGLSVLSPGIGVPSTDARGEAGYNTGRNGRTITWFGANYVNGAAGDTAGLYLLPFTGTSAAAPQVSGLAALLFSAHPGISNVEVRRVIEATCDPVGGEDKYSATGGTKKWSLKRGYGRINAAKALAMKPKA